ncbi:hypothetical protein SAMN03159463_02339 [Mesorhizobium sp. NFR06]|uniref:hypothetical protein n=1 Tax=Mesorhizobium sp. NFR06 TaxID=1566290 RepID=UPI0008E702D3|nr:hypothetical protein [Mesorhizobium sp. NFR06]SFO57930.1 hypothetical protein SAMN03159463_02339 [Mesorhizobium sp. NFR06]
MAYKDERVISILMEQAEATEERVLGYRDELKHAVADIIALERQNKFAKTNIAVKVGDIVSRVGTYLNKHTGTGS